MQADRFSLPAITMRDIRKALRESRVDSFDVSSDNGHIRVIIHYHDPLQEEEG